MKFYKPRFSLFLIFIQLLLSVKAYYLHQKWVKENPDLDALITIEPKYIYFFLFISIIGLCEMLTQPGRLKTGIRISMVIAVLGLEFSEFVPIDQFYYAVYNTTWFAAFIASILILIYIVKWLVKIKK